ncbi:MAG: hypothetical protein VX672_05040 [Planctomycetota bacterium]|nr:hypothetical protein [Planctomycetota bacterium]
MRQRDQCTSGVPLVATAIAVGIAAQAASQQLVPDVAVPQPLDPGDYTVGGSEFVEAWVDADFNLANPSVGDPSRAFQDIGSAINAVANQVAINLDNGLGPQEGLVHVNPGIYAIDEVIVLRPNVHVQGKDAHACIVRPSDVMSRTSVFLPTGSSCGSYDNLQVLMASYNTQTSSVDEVVEVVEGLQFQGGDVQLYINKEGPGALTFANCIFDMLPGRDSSGSPGPLFGVLMVETWDLISDGYNDFTGSFLNNTFIQGGFFSERDAIYSVAGRDNSVALASVNNPICGSPFGDPNPTLRQVCHLNVQNNCFRSLSDSPRTSMIGVSRADTIVAVGSPAGPSNAFVQGTAGIRSIGGAFSSVPIENVPVFAVDLASADPRFAGECTQALLESLGLPGGDRRDWRLLPGSPLVDRGSAPLDNGILQSASRVAYFDHYGDLRPRSAFDWDGEHYGNRRVVGRSVDIGADEANEYLLVGRANDSLEPRYPGLEFAIIDRPSRVRLRGVETNPSTVAWSSPPGSRVPPLLEVLPGSGVQLDWLLHPSADPGQGTSSFVWSNPADGGAVEIHYLITSLIGNTCSQIKIRGLIGGTILSNLQYTE